MTVNGQDQFGVNKDIANGVAMRPWRLYQIEIRRQYYDRLRDENPGEYNQMPQFFAHAEFTCLHLAYQRFGSLPAHLKMDVDRTLCRFDDGCTFNLFKTLSWFGITELYIRDANDRVMKLTATGTVFHQTMTLEQWAAFTP